MARSKIFFTGWQTWEKLVFVLACAIVVTLCAGCIKSAHTHWRSRRYFKMADGDRKEQKIQRQMSQHQTATEPTQRTSGNEKAVPFGIRAIEKGIEVDGVWISRGNSPEGYRKDSVTEDSSLSDDERRKDRDLDLEKQEYRRGHQRGRRSTVSMIELPRSDRSFVRTFTAGNRTSSKHSNRGSSVDSPIFKPPRSKHPPSSYIRYSCNPYLIRHLSAGATLEGLEAIHRASTSIHSFEGSPESSSSSRQSKESSGDDDPISASAPALLNGRLPTRPRTMQYSSSEFELMNTHRKSQVAETGQLTPRVRKPGQSSSVDSTDRRPDSRVHLSESRRSGYFSLVNGSKTQPSATDGHKKANLSSSSASSTSTIPSRRTKSVDVTPFAKFCQSTPPSPPSRNNSSEKILTPSVFAYEDSDNDSSSSNSSDLFHSTPPSPLIPASDGAACLSLSSRQPPPLHRPSPSFEKIQHPPTLHRPSSSFEKVHHRPGDILRGAGTGFEILQPGSFSTCSTTTITTNRVGNARSSKVVKPAAPPISLQNFAVFQMPAKTLSQQMPLPRSESWDVYMTSAKKKLVKKKRRQSDLEARAGVEEMMSDGEIF